MQRNAFACLVLVLALSAGASARAETRVIVVPANDGYGVADCLGGSGSCGRIVADAWCQAQGLRAAVSYGPSDPADTTSALPASAANSAPTYTVTCED